MARVAELFDGTQIGEPGLLNEAQPRAQGALRMHPIRLGGTRGASIGYAVGLAVKMVGQTKPPHGFGQDPPPATPETRPAISQNQPSNSLSARAATIPWN